MLGGGWVVGQLALHHHHTPHLAMSQGGLDNWIPVLCPSHNYLTNIYVHLSGLAGTGKLLRNEVWKPSLSCLKPVKGHDRSAH